MWALFEKGGPIMWPLLVVSVISLAVILERLFFLITEIGKRNEQDESDILLALEAGDNDRARDIASKTKDTVVKVLGAGIGLTGSPLTAALLHASAIELKRFVRGLVILDTAITISPLLGLLGTVTGMINAFGLLGAAELSAPTVITGGIAEALIATAYGLAVAICALLPFNYLTARAEEVRHEIEQATNRLEVVLDRRTAVNG